MKDFDYYNTCKTPYPGKNDFTVVYGYKKGKLEFEMSANEWLDERKSYPDVTVEKDFDEVAYRVARTMYNEECSRLKMEFMKDVFEDTGVEDNPRRFKAFDYAWQEGHSGGYSEVYSIFCELADIIE